MLMQYQINHINKLSTYMPHVQAFLEDPDHPPAIIAHELLPGQLQRQTITGVKIYKGAVHQFGSALHNKALVNAGLGPRLRVGLGESGGYAESPTVLVAGESQEMDIAGR